MTGPEHYRQAEQILAEAENSAPDASCDDVALMLQFANTHFTAATAAATALRAALPLIGDDQQVSDWCKAIGVTVGTSQSARITSALSLIDEMTEDGRIIDGADQLRAALGQMDDGR
jgi:hypothetical protein